MWCGDPSRLRPLTKAKVVNAVREIENCYAVLLIYNKYSNLQI